MTEDEKTAVQANVDSIGVNSRHGGLPTLTRQETEFAAILATTGESRTAGERAGIEPRKAAAWARRSDILAHVEVLQADYRRFVTAEIKYDLADAHADIEMGKRMAANATEWFKGVEMLMKLHGLADQKATTEVNINVNNIGSRSQLEQLDDGALLKMAGMDFEDLLPEAIDAEYAEA